MDNIAVSVIVPVYNVEKYLERCVASLVKQTLSNIEIILIDDGSKDNSGKLADELATLDSRIKVIHKVNAGQGLARNNGLDIASGKYVCFIDSDDYIELNSCERMYQLMEDAEADMCTFGHQIDDPYGKCVRTPAIKDAVYDEESIKSSFVLHFFGDDPADDNLRGFSSCMSVFKNSVIQENNLRFLSEREVLSEDNLFCLEFCKYAKKIITTSEVFYHYCQKIDSFSQGYSAVRMDMTKKLIARYREYARYYGVTQAAEIRIAGLVWINLMATIKQDVRRTYDGSGISKQEVISDIRKLCADAELRQEVARLKGKGLPIQQELFLRAFTGRQVYILWFMAAVRAKERI